MENKAFRGNEDEIRIFFLNKLETKFFESEVRGK